MKRTEYELQIFTNNQEFCVKINSKDYLMMCEKFREAQKMAIENKEIQIINNCDKRIFGDFISFKTRWIDYDTDIRIYENHFDK